MTDRNRLIAYGVVAFAVLVVLANTVFVVGQREQALVLRFGQPVGSINAPGASQSGLQLKIPFFEHVIKFDRRILSLEAQQEEVIAADQARLVVDAFVRYRIVDPLAFYRALRTQQIAQDRLERLVTSSLREVLGAAPSDDIVSRRRGQLMLLTQRDMDRRAREARYGLQIVDVRIRRADLPQANREAVYQRMRTSRQQQAAQVRGLGEQRNREITAQANRDVTILIAGAQADAGRIQGEGDARRAQIFAESFGQDPEFAAFWRTMQAYDSALGQGGAGATLVLSPDSSVLRYLRDGPGGR